MKCAKSLLSLQVFNLMATNFNFWLDDNLCLVGVNLQNVCFSCIKFKENIICKFKNIVIYIPRFSFTSMKVKMTHTCRG